MLEENELTHPIDLLTIGPLIGLTEAAEKSGYHAGFLRQAIKRGRLKAKKIASDWLTTMAAVEEYKNSRSLKNVPKKYRDRT